MGPFYPVTEKKTSTEPPQLGLDFLLTWSDIIFPDA